MRSLSMALLVLLLFTTNARAAKPRYVLLISIDGLGWKAFSDPKAKLPTLRGLAQQGISGPSRTVFPSMTWPSHTTLITGNMPRRHGVVGNRHFDRTKKATVYAWKLPRKELIKCPTLFDVLKRANIPSAALLWPGTQGDTNIDWNIPEVYGQRNFRKWSTPGLLKELQRAGLPGQWWGAFSKREMYLLDTMVRDTAIWLIKTKKPRFMAVHFVGADTVGHIYGPRTVPMFWMLAQTDRYIKQILDSYREQGLLAQTTVFVVSDHGFLKVKTKLDADKLLKQNDLIKDIKKLSRGPVVTVSQGQAMFVYLLDKTNRQLHQQKVIKLFRSRSEVERILTPARFGRYGLPTPRMNSRVGDLIILGKPEVIFRRVRKKSALVSRAGIHGMHGYLPSHPNNRPLFIAAGNGIQPRKKQIAMNNLDVAPTILKLFGLTFKTSIRGKVRSDLLK